MSYTGKTNWQYDEIVTETDLNRIEQGVVDAHAGLEDITPGQIGAASKTEFDAHTADYIKHPGFGVASGSNNAYVVTLDPAPTSYVNGMGVAIAIHVNSTAAATINVNGLGAKKVLKANGGSVTNLKANGIYTLRYNPLADAGSGAFILQGEGGGVWKRDSS